MEMEHNNNTILILPEYLDEISNVDKDNRVCHL